MTIHAPGTAADIGDRMRRLRLARGKSLQELGEAIGCTHQALSGYERGEHPPSATRLHEIAKALDAPAGYFFGEATVSL